MTVQQILEQMVEARERRVFRAREANGLHYGTVSADELDLLLLDLLAAQLELAREREEAS